MMKIWEFRKQLDTFIIVDIDYPIIYKKDLSEIEAWSKNIISTYTRLPEGYDCDFGYIRYLCGLKKTIKKFSDKTFSSIKSIFSNN